MTSLLDLLNLEEDLDDEMPMLFVPSSYCATDEAQQVILDNKDKFNLLSLNCQSLFAKIDQLQIYLQQFATSECSF